MRSTSRPLLLMHPDARFRERVRAACGGEYRLEEVRDWDAMGRAVRDAPPAAVVVAWPYEVEPEARSSPGRLSRALRELLQSYPSTAVLAALDVGPASYEDLRTLGRWGVVQVISHRHDDTPLAIRQRLRSARGRPLRALIEEVLPPETSARARAILDAATDIVLAGDAGQDLADALHLSPRTLLRWCQRSGLPAPRQLLAWMRVLLACELLDDPGRPVLSVAQTCGYSSDSGLRRITQKFLGMTPTELREKGAFSVAVRAFVEVLEGSRRARVASREA